MSCCLLNWGRAGVRASNHHHPPQADSDLEAIRQRRMQELMGQYGGQMPTQEQAQEKEEKQLAEQEQRQAMLTAVLSVQARERRAYLPTRLSTLPTTVRLTSCRRACKVLETGGGTAKGGLQHEG